jgi:fructose/tagatose bisphosphate aldolase
LIDRLAHTGALGATPELKGTARWILRSVAAARGIRPASIHELYMAMGRGETGGFTVPAMNIRVMSYYTARAALRAARKANAGAIIFEIARSEIGYTEQRPHEYAAMITAAALREEFTGPLFIQGDHVQVNAKKYRSADRDKELDALKALIREEIAAAFYNIDIDTSTLVDLDKPTLDDQQAVNCELAAEFTEFCRRHEPDGVSISVGGEIGEVGGKNSDVHELHAFMRGYNAALRKRGEQIGISKISVQTGTAHGGFVGADGKVRMDVQIDLEALEELSRVARKDYGLGGAAFKARLWSLDESVKNALGQSLEERFAFLMDKLNVGGTADAVRRFMNVPEVSFNRDHEVNAAAGVITAAERKAEGLSD